MLSERCPGHQSFPFCGLALCVVFRRARFAALNDVVALGLGFGDRGDRPPVAVREFVGRFLATTPSLFCLLAVPALPLVLLRFAVGGAGVHFVVSTFLFSWSNTGVLAVPP